MDNFSSQPLPRALYELADFSGRRVLEIGCGDGRLTCVMLTRRRMSQPLNPSRRAMRGQGKTCQKN